MNKKQRYQKLVAKINKNLDDGKYGKGFFINCPDFKLDEVNAWTYWQGRGNINPDIMLIGQDWGAINDRNSIFIDNIRKMIDVPNHTSTMVEYFKDDQGTKLFKTDENICCLFSALEYKDVHSKCYEELFFTNLIPGFRPGQKSTGGFKQSWISEDIKDELKELVDILNPRIVICLGNRVYKAVLATFDKNVTFKKWTDYLDEFYEKTDLDPIQIADNTYVFPVVHPGVFGTRKRSVEKQIHDWEKIAKWKNHHC